MVPYAASAGIVLAIRPEFAAALPSLPARLPAEWGWIVMAAILAFALMAHLALVVRESRVLPASLASDLERTVGGGNYQEAWELCRSRKGVYLAGISAPALEKIGYGHVAVSEARVAGEAKASKPMRIPLWCLLGVASAATLLLLVSSVSALSLAGDATDVRDWTVRSGIAWVEAAGWFGIALPAWLVLAGDWKRAKRLFLEAEQRIDGILSRIPYEDLEGVNIGEHFSAGPAMGGLGAEGVQTLRVSKDLTTHCPQCNTAVKRDAKTCPKCGAVLDWK